MAVKKGPTKAELEAKAREEMAKRIRVSVEEGRGKSMFDVDDSTDMDRMHGPMCRCGVPRKPPGISKHVNDDGRCTVHPDREPQPWTRGAG
jgi:hypothetical protein